MERCVPTEPKAMNVLIEKRRKQKCLCCAFDLFLPPGFEMEDDNFVVTTTSQQGKKNKDGEDDDYDESTMLTPREVVSTLLMMKNDLNLNDKDDDNDDDNGDTKTKRDGTAKFFLFDTHGHAQLNREKDEMYVLLDGQPPPKEQEEKEQDSSSIPQPSLTSLGLKSIACAVEPDDWETTLQYATTSDTILPALGIHPWYLHGLEDGWLVRLEQLLVEHPNTIVGEIGLCKMARFVRNHPEGKSVALAMQRSVCKEQMMLAAKLRRPVSVHCVEQQGVFVDLIKELVQEWEDNNNKNNDDEKKEKESDESPLPPAIAMHSFTGTAHHIKNLLSIETGLSSSSKKSKRKTQQQKQNQQQQSQKQQQKGNLTKFYFGFSHAVNYVMCTSTKAKRKGRDAVRAVPIDRLLIESDVHSPDDLLGGTAGALAYVSWCRHMPIEECAKITSRNGISFAKNVSNQKKT